MMPARAVSKGDPCERFSARAGERGGRGEQVVEQRYEGGGWRVEGGGCSP